MTDCSRRFILPLLLIVLAAVPTLRLANDALAQLTTVFELDGNAITGAHVGLPDDWDRVYSGTGSAGLSIFQTDPQGISLFGKGSKDIYDINTWKWADQNAPPKDDITNAYAAVYGGKLFFGADRYSTNGTAYIGFWLLKGTAVFNAGGTVTGNHQIGDILILADFVNGGGTVVPRVFEWVGSGGSHGSLNEKAIDINTAYALVNSANATSPWPYEGKNGSGVFATGAFFEGGADLGALGITGCFTDFICETRSSSEVTAELKDFVHHQFPASPQITVNDAAICHGGSAILTATVTGGVPPFTYAWSNGAITQSIEVSTPGVYTVTVSGANGCSGQGTGTLTVNPLPTCNITGTNAICTGATTSFCATAGMTSYAWTGPSGFTAATQCTGPISAAGLYSVTITDAHGCQSTCSRTLTVYSLPSCSVTGTNAICVGATTSFCATAGMASYAWTGPSGLTAGTQCTGPISAAGTYTVTITDANGCQSTCNRTLTVYTLPNCNITGTNAICVGATTSFCATAGMASYAWSGPGGFSVTTQCTGPISAAGTYTATITDANGCQSTCNRTLTVYTLPNCSISRTGGERDTICPCFSETDPAANNEYCGPAGMAFYTWAIVGGADIVGGTADQCVIIRPRSHCDTTFTLTLTVADGHGCGSTCDRTVFVVDKTPPIIVYCPPDTVLECDDNLDDAFNPLPAAVGPGARSTNMSPAWQPVALDNCDDSPGTDYADTGGRPTNWQRRVDSWGGCGEDTTILRTWTATDDCGNQAVCHQVIAIQDTVPPALTCVPGETVPCGTEVVFTPPSNVTDNCDPLRLLDVAEVSTDVVPGPDPGEFTHTRCWVATDSCQNASAICCQSIIVEACPDKFCTFTQGGWGSECPEDQEGNPSSTQPGCILERYFAQAFPGGSVGIGDPAGVNAGHPNLYAAVWTNPDAVQAFLPAGGTPGMLTSDVTNPVGTGAGVLAGHILSLRLNVEFSCSGVFRDAGLSTGVSCYRGFLIPASCGKFAGLTVEQFLAVADEAVGGRKNALRPYGATLSDLNFTATCLNQLFDNCVGPVSAGLSDPASGDARLETTAGAGEDAATVLVPKRFFVRQSYPNPFNPSATIVFGLPRDGNVTVEICDVAGRSIITLLDEARQAGYHSAVWFGRDGNGNAVASGVYFCRVRFGDETDVQKLILLR